MTAALPGGRRHLGHGVLLRGPHQLKRKHFDEHRLPGDGRAGRDHQLAGAAAGPRSGRDVEVNEPGIVSAAARQPFAGDLEAGEGLGEPQRDPGLRV